MADSNSPIVPKHKIVVTINVLKKEPNSIMRIESEVQSGQNRGQCSCYGQIQFHLVIKMLTIVYIVKICIKGIS